MGLVVAVVFVAVTRLRLNSSAAPKCSIVFTLVRDSVKSCNDRSSTVRFATSQ
jgi:hypothetical protein